MTKSGADKTLTCAAVVIGRNEGQRLIACLDSLAKCPDMDRVVYVDSGSTDGSQKAAQKRGAELIALDLSVPFTAARARNAGIEHLRALASPPDYIQFLDGDCVMQCDWPGIALSFLDKHPDAAVVCGRRREQFPNATIWNAMIDAEWDTPIGQARSCGGDAMMRLRALNDVGGYDPELIAGEEPELCVRLRSKGWKIWRIEAEMTMHDAALTRLGQWWQRTKRGGYAFAEGAAMHGAPPERHKVGELCRALIWGLALPIMTLIAALVSPWGLLLLLLWPAQMLRLWRTGRPLRNSVFLTLAKIPEAHGALIYGLRRLRGAERTLIEYK